MIVPVTIGGNNFLTFGMISPIKMDANAPISCAPNNAASPYWIDTEIQIGKNVYVSPIITGRPEPVWIYPSFNGNNCNSVATPAPRSELCSNNVDCAVDKPALPDTSNIGTIFPTNIASSCCKPSGNA